MTTQTFEAQVINEDDLEAVQGGIRRGRIEQWKMGEGPLANYYKNFDGTFLTYQDLFGND